MRQLQNPLLLAVLLLQMVALTAQLAGVVSQQHQVQAMVERQAHTGVQVATQKITQGHPGPSWPWMSYQTPLAHLMCCPSLQVLMLAWKAVAVDAAYYADLVYQGAIRQNGFVGQGDIITRM
jgi:hypothetical protein